MPTATGDATTTKTADTPSRRRYVGTGDSETSVGAHVDSAKDANMPRERPEISSTKTGHRLFEIEAKLLEEGRADIRAGHCISGSAADAWLADLDGDHELAIPGSDGGRVPPRS